MPGSARVARRRFSFGEPLCSAAVTRQNSAPDLLRGGSVSCPRQPALSALQGSCDAGVHCKLEASASRVASGGSVLVFRFCAGSQMWHGCQQGALRGEHRGAAALSRLVETAAMHSMHPAAPMPPPSAQLLEPPPALQLDSVAAPAAAEAAAAATADATQHGEEGPTPRSSSRVRNNRQGIKVAAAASVRALWGTKHRGIQHTWLLNWRAWTHGQGSTHARQQPGQSV